ncbi:hypothetical protein LGN17_02355 [Burkholderia sp. AU30280]|uniref:hypothetical protein n=1 Tax=unclassified Burkholderia TaxID=2613784 RepID=UPI001CF0F2AF|nr:hypothetical protein [Burkholderia sp. AU30280]MCA8271361.1 hypothetical protein [Burkholderia sp. AU30280]
MATTFFAGAAFLAATFLVAGAAAFLATFLAEVAMFLLPGVVVGYTKRATRALQRRILQAPRRFVQYFYAFSRGFPQVFLHATDCVDAPASKNAFT